MSVRDTLNNCFMLPDMGDFYYDVPDQEFHMSTMDRVLNPITPHNPISAYRFYQEDPPMDIGYDSEHMIYMFGVKLGENKALGQSYNPHSVRDLIVDDGDTVQIPYNRLVAGDIDSAQYLQETSDKYWSDLVASGYHKVREDEVPLIGLRFACIDTKELPHFIPIGKTDEIKAGNIMFWNPKDSTISYNEAYTDPHYTVSRYQCFADNAEKIPAPTSNSENNDVSDAHRQPDFNNRDNAPVYKNSTFYNYSRKSDQINVMRYGDVMQWAQYFDYNGYRFVCVQSGANDYSQEQVADAGLARDIVANMIANAEEMRIMVNGCTISRSGDQPVSMLKTDSSASVNNSARKFLESIFDGYTAFTSAGYNEKGQDLHGRLVSVVYVKVNGQWINLNKMVKVDTDCTLTNTYANNKLLSNEKEADYMVSLFKPESYNVEFQAYCDSIIEGTLKFDDREKVQNEILGELNKEKNAYIKPTDWSGLKNWTVIIGDVVLMIPPTSIHTITQSKAQRRPLLRARGSMAKSATKSQKILNLDLYFYGDEGVNGIEYKTRTGMQKDQQEITYWMNGLRALIAQFKVAPFLPIENEFINNVMNIDAVSMLDMTLNTVPNFPSLIKCTLQLAEFEYRIYMPEVPKYEKKSQGIKNVNYFAKQINYPLFRYFYQRLIRNGEDLKDVKFLSEKYITNTFGNKTCLIPMDFGDSKVKFYIPNEAQLKQLKQLKISRLQKSGMMPNLSAKDVDFATDVSKIYDAINKAEEAKSAIANLNTKLNEAPITFFMSFNNGKYFVHKIKNGVTYDTLEGSKEAQEDGMSTEWLTEYTNAQIEKAFNAYKDALGGLKNANGQPLCVGVHTENNYVLENHRGLYNYIVDSLRVQSYKPYGNALIINTDVKYMTDDELLKLKTEATTRTNTSNSADEIFKERQLAIPIYISIPTETEYRQLGPIIEDDDTVSREEIYFSIAQGIDTDFIAFLKEVATHGDVKGNATANDMKQSIDWISKDTLKFEELKLNTPLIATAISLNFSNIFSQITLQSVNSYAPQYMGGSDIGIQVNAITLDETVAATFDQLPDMSATYAREYGLVLAAWPLKIESQLTKLVGITDVMIDSASVSTIPNYPGAYQIELNLVSVDRSLRNRESMKKTDLEETMTDTSKEGLARRKYWEYESINHLLSEAELYPDLELPTLKELQENGFEFVRYSNKQRKYPDPDFYFTYTHVLVPQIIREAVIHMFDHGDLSGKLELGGEEGHLNGSILQHIGSYERDFELEKEWNKSIEEVFNDPDKTAEARIMRDFLYDTDEDRTHLWTITPKIKVALLERRYLSHIADEKRKDYKDTSSMAQLKDQENNPKKKNTDEQEQNAAAATQITQDRAKREAQDKPVKDYIAKQEEAVQEQLDKVFDEIFAKPVGSDFKCIETMANAMKSGTKPVQFDDKLIDSMFEAAADTQTGDSVYTFFMNSDGKYRHPAYGAVGTAVVNGQNYDIKIANTQYEKQGSAFGGDGDEGSYWTQVADIAAAATDSEEDTQEVLNAMNKTEKDILNEIIAKATAGEMKARVDLLQKYGTSFGVYLFKTYSESELKDLTGEYDPLEYNGKKATKDLNERYLLDPYYRFASLEEIESYKRQCCTNNSFAKRAFARIVAFWLYKLAKRRILPSYTFDILRSVLDKPQLREQVMKSIDELKNRKRQTETGGKYNSQELDKIYKENEANSNSNDDSVTSPSDDDMDSLVSQNKSGSSVFTSSDSTNNGSGIVKQDSAYSKIGESYQQQFQSNCNSIDTGKIFLATLTALTSGNKELMTALSTRNYEVLESLSQSALTGQRAQFQDRGLVYTMNALLLDMAGRGGIDTSDISTGGPYSAAAIEMQMAARRNVAAASSDPKLYLVHSFYDMVTHDCRGRMLRAFPTFYFAMIDEGREFGVWKLHDNFYNTNAIANLTITKSRKMATDVAEITVSNFYQTFTTEDEDINTNYTVNLTDVFRSMWLPTLRGYALEQEEKRKNAQPLERFKLRPGARVHVRIGYGSDGMALPIAFNGCVAEVEVGDYVQLICQSDGSEISQPILIDEKSAYMQDYDDVSGNWCYSGATPKTIITSLLECHGGAANTVFHDMHIDHLTDNFGMTTNPFGLTHFGSRDQVYGCLDMPKESWGDATEKRLGQLMGVGALVLAGAAILGTGGLATPLAAGLAGVGAASLGIGGGALYLDASADAVRFGESFKEISQNILEVAPIGTGNRYGESGLPEKNDTLPTLTFELFGKTIWDVLHICKSTDPSYITDVAPFDMRSTIFFGRPHDYYAYTYQKVDGIWCEKRKPYQQYHIYDSYCDIIGNQIKIESNSVKTCAVGMYSVQGQFGAKVQKKTPPQWIDKDIYPEFQKTYYFDTQLFGMPSRRLGVVSDLVNNLFLNWVSQSNEVLPDWLSIDNMCSNEGPNNHNHLAMATVMTRDSLKTAIGEMYQGQLVVIGDPTVKPFDRLIISDTYHEINGQVQVRDVVQNFSFETGYTTSITPDLIATTIEETEEEIIASSAMQKTGSIATILYGMLRNPLLSDVKSNNPVPSDIDIDNSKEAQELKEAADKNRVAAANNLATPIPPFAMLGGIANYFKNWLESRRSLTLFPLLKYGKVMVGGIDGHTGLVYGSPSYEEEGPVDTFLSQHLGANSFLGSAIKAVGFKNIYDAASSGNKQLMQQVITQDKLRRSALSAANESHLNEFRKTLIDPTIKRVEINDVSVLDTIKVLYGVYGTTEQAINQNQNFQRLRCVLNDKHLKPFIDLGFLRVLGNSQSTDGIDKTRLKNMYLISPPTTTYNPVNVLFGDKDGDATIINVPYLDNDAIAILFEIVDKTLQKLAGTEQTRDCYKWYKDNSESMLVLKTALQVNSTTPSCTGFNFSIQASNSKTAQAMNAAIKSIQESFAKNAEKGKDMEAEIFYLKDNGADRTVADITVKMPAEAK